MSNPHQQYDVPQLGGPSFEFVRRAIVAQFRRLQEEHPELRQENLKLWNEITERIAACEKVLAVLQLDAPHVSVEDAAELTADAVGATASFIWGRGPSCDWSLLSFKGPLERESGLEELLEPHVPKRLLVEKKPVPRTWELDNLSALFGVAVTDCLWLPIIRESWVVGAVGALQLKASPPVEFGSPQRQTLAEAAERLAEKVVHRLFAGSPARFPTCFISYSHLDEGFARRLYERMREESITVGSQNAGQTDHDRERNRCCEPKRPDRHGYA